ncbi:MAG TPA: glutamyl-tRNA reductase [Phycisphaerae bacterium]|nr:glutamyl-tRNA reductase [Phycisphaerae bacterium]
MNHKTATLAVRETLAFSEPQADAALESFRARFPGAEAVLLSTCNRVELYVATPADAPLPGEVLTHFLAEAHGLASAGEIHPHMYVHHDRRMVDHLFAVATSLDSIIVGETQILAQVKQAYLAAAEKGTVGKTFHALFQRALAAAKDAHESTRLASGRLSVASVAVDLAASVFDRFDDKTVLCVGAGKMAGLMLRHLADLRPRRALIANRSLEHAQALAAEMRGLGVAVEARGMEELDALLALADIVLTSTGATQPLLTAARYRPIQKARRYRPAVVVDIAVPRDVEASVASLPNVYLYNVDDLQNRAAGNKAARDAQIAAAKSRLDLHAADFFRWLAARDVGPLVKALYEHCQQIAQSELAAAYERAPDLTDAQRAELQRLTHRVVGKILHGPVTRLTAPEADAATALPETPDAQALSAHLAGALQELFNLHLERGSAE